MAADFTIKRGDTAPTFIQYLSYTDGTVANLSGASVQFVMRSASNMTTTIDAAATVVSASGGEVSYTFSATDTAIAGHYMATWIVTFSNGSQMTFPTDGYLEIFIEDDLLLGGTQQLLGLGEVKDHLRIPMTDRTHDGRLVDMIKAIRPVVENVTGPILPTTYTESYDGGNWFIVTRHAPLLQVHSVVEYRGPLGYNLTQVPTPDLGQTYSYEIDAWGRIIRRTVGGGITPFPPGADQVIVTYTAGYNQVPANVREACLMLIATNYQVTEMAGSPHFGGGINPEDNPGGLKEGFLVPDGIAELLDPHKRHPSIA